LRAAVSNKTTPGYLGSYRLLNVINTGHASQMWQAYNDAQQQYYAVKMLLDRFRQDREQIGYLKREQEVGGNVQHPRLIRIAEYGVHNGIPFLALEWYPSPNMKQRIHQGLEPIAAVMQTVILQAVEGVAYLNSLGWVHRDIKPDNFLVADSGDVKLIDFSLAVRSAGFFGRLFAVKQKVQGTRSYISPEQILGSAVDTRADQYSLACTLFELVGGKPPFTGTNSNELLSKHLKSAPPSLEVANRNATPEFGQVLRRAMAKRPDDRYRSTGEFYEELRGIRLFRRDFTPSRASADKD
jgi:serine/threonine protein kinase